MLVLGIHTAGPACEAAVTRDGVSLSNVAEGMINGHDARLAGVVQRALDLAGIAPTDLDRIAVVTGPGSFTGIRVGVAFARGLALALDRPCYGITSLEALEGVAGAGFVLGVLPAKVRPPEQSWWAQHLRNGSAVGDAMELDLGGVLELAAGVDCVCGEAGALAEAGLSVRSARPSALEAAIRAAALGMDAPAIARPVYVRAPDAKPMSRP